MTSVKNCRAMSETQGYYSMTRDTEPNGDDSDYLFVVSYADDAERKRVEYLFNNWDEGDVERPDGIVRVASDIDHDDIYERVVNKVPSEQVDSFELRPVEADVDRERRTVKQSVSAPADAVKSFVDYIFSKKKAVLQSGARNEYEVYTKKGRADVTYELTRDDGTVIIKVTVSGYPPAPGFLADFFKTELSDYAESQQ